MLNFAQTGSYGTAATEGSSSPPAATSSFSTCLPQLQHNFFQQQHTLSQQQYDSQLYSLTNTSFQQQNLNLSPLEIEQDKKDEGEVEEEEDYDQNQDPSNERSGSKWKHDEIKVLLDYIQENYSAWSKGNKSKFNNDMVKSVLPNKESNAIKSKLARLTKKYESTIKWI